MCALIVPRAVACRSQARERAPASHLEDGCGHSHPDLGSAKSACGRHDSPAPPPTHRGSVVPTAERFFRFTIKKKTMKATLQCLAAHCPAGTSTAIDQAPDDRRTRLTNAQIEAEGAHRSVRRVRALPSIQAKAAGGR